jgi:TolB protein
MMRETRRIARAVLLTLAPLGGVVGLFGVFLLPGASAPAPSPAGLIAFSSRPPDKKEESDIYVMNADGTNLRRLTFRPGWNSDPTWSPDGRIAFSSGLAHSGESDIYTMDRHGRNLHRLTNFAGTESLPSWSPDGTQIAFNWNGAGIFVIDADGTNRRFVVEGASASWSPDGKQIAFSSWRPNEVDGPRANGIVTRIYTINVDGSGLTLLWRRPGADAFGPAWSPDGKWIALGSSDGIHIVDATGSNGRRVVEFGSEPTWTSDSRRIVFAVLSGPRNRDIYIVDIDGNNLQRLTDRPDDEWSPSWFEGTLSVSPMGKGPSFWGGLKRSGW